MADKDNDRQNQPHPEEPPRPRLWWLAGFHVAIIALVVAMSRYTRELSPQPQLEDELGAGSRGALQEALQQTAWGGRGWRAALIAMIGALLLMLPIVWAYVATRERRKVDHSVVATVTLLPLAVAAILVIVQDSLAVAFSLAGIAGLVRFRNALDDTKDAMYVFVAIAVGLGAGVGALEASAALSGLYNLVVIALWKWNTAPPAIADIALGEQSMPEGKSVLETMRPSEKPGRHPEPSAEWLERAETKSLSDQAPNGKSSGSKREGILRVQAASDSDTRRVIEQVLNDSTKRWTLESDSPDPDGLPQLTYQVRLKKRVDSQQLLDVLRQEVGPKLAHYAPIESDGSKSDGSNPPASG
jgi:Domain of unknown function (DUF4956)